MAGSAQCRVGKTEAMVPNWSYPGLVTTEQQGLPNGRAKHLAKGQLYEPGRNVPDSLANKRFDWHMVDHRLVHSSHSVTWHNLWSCRIERPSYKPKKWAGQGWPSLCLLLFFYSYIHHIIYHTSYSSRQRVLAEKKEKDPPYSENCLLVTSKRAMLVPS